jgi:hypothetical protein
MLPSRIFVWALLYAACTVSSAQSPFHQRIQETYSFQPHALSKEQISQKSAVLDTFWNSAKSNPGETLPLLRAELKDVSNPPFFLYDGSMLLLSLSNTHEDHIIALTALAHCDLRDVQPREYFLQVHQMASTGEDATAAALHILSDPNFKVLIPQHALTLDQDYSLVYLLLPMKDQLWLQPAIEQLARERDEKAETSLLLALWYAQRPSADQAIASFAADNSKPAPVRKSANELMARRSDLVTKVKAVASSEESIRQKRMERMKNVSDEALYDLDAYTGEIIAKRK